MAARATAASAATAGGRPTCWTPPWGAACAPLALRAPTPTWPRPAPRAATAPTPCLAPPFPAQLGALAVPRALRRRFAVARAARATTVRGAPLFLRRAPAQRAHSAAPLAPPPLPPARPAPLATTLPRLASRPARIAPLACSVRGRQPCCLASTEAWSRRPRQPMGSSLRTCFPRAFAQRRALALWAAAATLQSPAAQLWSCSWRPQLQPLLGSFGILRAATILG